MHSKKKLIIIIIIIHPHTHKMKRQPTDWEKIFANDMTDKGLVSKIYKQSMILNSIKKKKNQQMGRGPKQTFF